MARTQPPSGMRISWSSIHTLFTTFKVIRAVKSSKKSREQVTIEDRLELTTAAVLGTTS